MMWKGDFSDAKLNSNILTMGSIDAGMVYQKVTEGE